MSRAVIGLLIALPALSFADRLISIPTARKLPFKTVRYEIRFEPGEFGARENFLAAGIGPAIETELRTALTPTSRNPGTFDLSYNYIAAIPGLSPGLSFGVQDAANIFAERRRFYAVTTYRLPADVINGEFPLDVSLGYFVGYRSSPFVGVLIPFSKEFHLLAEDDGTYIAAGVEFRPNPTLNFRAQWRDNRPLLSAQVTTHF